MSNIITSTFKSLYKATKETLHVAKEPLVQSKNKRAFESAIDSATDTKLEAEESLNKELEVVKEGKVININNVLKYRQTIKDADETIAELTVLKDEFFK